MTWFKVDDKLHAHKKARKAGKAAMGLWVLAGSWSADNLTDGFIPATQISACLGTRTDAARLVSAGLWIPCVIDGEDGWLFKDWPTYNPLREEVEQKREETAERVRKWRERQKEKARLYLA